MKLSKKLAFLYTQGFKRDDVARLTRSSVEVVAEWEAEAGNADQRALDLLLDSTVLEINGYLEQQKALDVLFAAGLHRTDVTLLLGVSPNTVRAWDAAKKLARSRMRERLLNYSRQPLEQLAALRSISAQARGRFSEQERWRRVTAMRDASLWPPVERARRMRQLIELAHKAGINKTELINLLGINRRKFYDYLNIGNDRLMSVEVVGRVQNIRALILEQKSKNSRLKLLTLEERFMQSSLVLFGTYYDIGFASGDLIKESALCKLAEETGYHKRTLRRYLPIRTDRRRVPRGVVEAFEMAARNLGTIV